MKLQLQVLSTKIKVMHYLLSTIHYIMFTHNVIYSHSVYLAYIVFTLETAFDYLSSHSNTIASHINLYMPV